MVASGRVIVLSQSQGVLVMLIALLIVSAAVGDDSRKAADRFAVKNEANTADRCIESTVGRRRFDAHGRAVLVGWPEPEPSLSFFFQTVNWRAPLRFVWTSLSLSPPLRY